jgi:DNA primase
MDQLKFLERHLGPYKSSRHEALFQCPFCNHHKPKLSVNVDKFYWHCWVCDKKGRSLFTLFWQMGERKVLAAYKAAFPESIEVYPEPEPGDFTLQLPTEYIPLCQNASATNARRAISYLKKRCVSTEQILKHKIGYANEGRFRNRIILPSFDAQGHLNFFTGRTFTNDLYKYLNPETPTGYKKTIVFNELNVDWNRPVFLVEGFFDMLNVEDNAIPLFGSTLPKDSKLLLNLVVHEPDVYVCLDADARAKQRIVLRNLISYGISCYDLDVRPYNDVGEMPSGTFEKHRQMARRTNRTAILHERIQSA